MTLDTLRSRLEYAPRELSFGTSGLRGPVVDLTNLEAWINTTGFLTYLEQHASLVPDAVIYTGSDLRVSSESRVQGRGQILQAVHQAIRDRGLRPVHLGRLPTPALTFHALQQGCASVMVTGSHIPFDRNGIKFNLPTGEVLKTDEAGIMACVAGVRRQAYDQPYEGSIFDAQGMLRNPPPLPADDESGSRAYVERYRTAFPGRPLQGRRILVYQHSAVGRDLLVHILEELGATAWPVGRSDTFVPIDTEDVREEQLTILRGLRQTVDGPVDALVSTDGDSDRPLLVSVSGPNIRFHGGDLLGIVVSQWLEADAVVVPVSANDAVEKALGSRVQPRTRIGSPYVIDAMQRASGQRIVGFEANGGFLLGSDIRWSDGRVLLALPTRDAVLPILAALSAAAGEDGPYSLARPFDRLPSRFSKAGLLDDFPVEASRRILQRFSLQDEVATEVSLDNEAQRERYAAIRTGLETVFSTQDGFGRVSWLNYVDGLRIGFDNGDVAHVRPSGNAPQLRIYANADTQARADAIVAQGIAEPDGSLRRLEHLVR